MRASPGSVARGPTSSRPCCAADRERGPAQRRRADERRAIRRQGTGSLVGLERRQARPRMALLGGRRSRLRRGAASSGSTTFPNASCPDAILAGADAGCRGGAARPAAPCGAGARHRERALPARLFSPRRRGCARAPCRTRRGRRARAGRRRGLEGTGLSRSRRRGCRAESRRGRSSRPSIPWSGSARAPSACSISATGSRSTRRPRSGSSAITACPSSSATVSSLASTSRPTGPADGSSSIPFTRKRASRPATIASPLAAELHAARGMAQA